MYEPDIFLESLQIVALQLGCIFYFFLLKDKIFKLNYGIVNS